MHKIAHFLKKAEATIDVSIDKYLYPYKEKIEYTLKEVEESKKDLNLYEEHLKSQMQNIIQGLKSVNLVEVFISGGRKSTPVGHFSIKNPKMSRDSLISEIKELGLKKVLVEETEHQDEKWFSVKIKLDSFNSFEKQTKSKSELDVLVRNEVV